MSDDCYCEWAYDREGRYLDYQCENCTLNERKANPWAFEKKIILSLFDELDMSVDIPARLCVIARLFDYVRTIPSFVVAHPLFRATVVSKLAELRALDDVAPIKETLDGVDVFLAKLD